MNEPITLTLTSAQRTLLEVLVIDAITAAEDELTDYPGNPMANAGVFLLKPVLAQLERR